VTKKGLTDIHLGVVQENVVMVGIVNQNEETHLTRQVVGVPPHQEIEDKSPTIVSADRVTGHRVSNEIVI
jgi:hypothetical protein